MKTNKGFTLIEMAVVLAIIAIMAAILTPIVTGYIDQARSTRADVDVSSIRDAMLLFKRDTGFFPAYDNLTAARTGTTPTRARLLSGTNAAAASPTGTGWAALCTTKGLIFSYLNINSLGLPTTASGGAVAYRGPYLDGLLGSDPWGNPYWINSLYLATSGPNANNWAFAISMGPDGVMNTPATQARTAVVSFTGDDIASLIN